MIACSLLTRISTTRESCRCFCKNGFDGKIYATEETVNLCKVMLLDSAHIQRFGSRVEKQEAKRSGMPPYEPMYTTQDAQCAVAKMLGCKYNEMKEVCENVSIRFNDMGHLLGSASIEIWITEGGVTENRLQRRCRQQEPPDFE